MKRQIYWLGVGLLLLSILVVITPVSTQAAQDGKRKGQITYETLNPRGLPQPIKRTPLAPRISDLNDKTVYVVNVGKTYSEEILAAIAKLLPEYFPRVKVVHTAKKTFYAEDEPELWKDVKERADAVIIAPKD